MSFVQLQRGRRFDNNEPAKEGEISALRAFNESLLELHDNVNQTKLEPLPLCEDPFPDHRERSVRRKPIVQWTRTE